MASRPSTEARAFVCSSIGSSPHEIKFLQPQLLRVTPCCVTAMNIVQLPFSNDYVHLSVDWTVVKDILLQEWALFKHLLVSEFKEVSTRDIMSTMSANTTFSSLYPTLSKLASIALIVPVSTADCERGFLTMNRIKTDPKDDYVRQTYLPLFRRPRAGWIQFWKSCYALGIKE